MWKALLLRRKYTRQPPMFDCPLRIAESPVQIPLRDKKALLTSFIESKSDMELVALFCDNGRTGTDFDRPQFEKMMEEVRKGRVNCIVVKDLSRFGRNYKETGNYLERIFPFLGIRFIAVNDNFDTLTAERT